MKRAAVLKTVLAATGMLGLAMAIVDCSHRSASAHTGSVQFALKLSSGAEIKTVDYLITGNGIAPITGSIDVSKFNVASALVSGVRAGNGYSVELEAASVDGKITCAGGADVNVMEGKTAQANIVLQCSDTKPTGSVTVTGTFDNCPVISSLVAMPLSASVGGVILLQARGSDVDGDPLKFTWKRTSTAATFGEPTQPDVRSSNVPFTCATAGTVTATVAVTDQTCGEEASITVTCVPAGSAGNTGGNAGGRAGGSTGGMPGGNQTGGQPASGGVSGMSGTGAVPGSGGAAGGMAAGGIAGGMMASVGGGGSGPGGTTRTGGTTGSGGTTGTGGMASGNGGSVSVTASCQACSFGPASSPLCAVGGECAACFPATDGCDMLTDAADKALCERIYACFMSHKSQCVNQGDPLKCWCGSNPTTCVTDNSPPTQANGLCRDLVFEGAKSTDAPTIKNRFVDPAFPLGRAVNLLSCRGTFCSEECGVP